MEIYRVANFRCKRVFLIKNKVAFENNTYGNNLIGTRKCTIQIEESERTKIINLNPEKHDKNFHECRLSYRKLYQM